MGTAFVIVKVLLAVALAASAIADFARYKQVLINMAKAGVPESWLPALATLKTAGALGLLVGFIVPLVGTAAAAGVVLFFVGAIITHLRARSYLLAPAVSFELVAVSALVLGFASSRALGV